MGAEGLGEFWGPISCEQSVYCGPQSVCFAEGKGSVGQSEVMGRDESAPMTGITVTETKPQPRMHCVLSPCQIGCTLNPSSQVLCMGAPQVCCFSLSWLTLLQDENEQPPFLWLVIMHSSSSSLITSRSSWCFGV